MPESNVKKPFFLMAVAVLFCGPVAAEPAAEPAAKSAAQPAAEPAAKSDVKADAKSAAEPAAKPAAEPAAKPTPEPAAEPAAKPAVKSAAKSAKPAVEPAAEPDLDIDFEALTCREFLAKDSGTQGVMLFWIDGYISRDRDVATTNQKWLEKLGNHLGQYCAKNGKKTMMDAIKDAPDED